MSRWAHSLLTLALVLAATAGPCSELLMSSRAGCHHCCGKQHGAPAKSPNCEILCNAADQPVAVFEFVPSPVSLSPGPLASQLVPYVAAAQCEAVAPINTKPPGRLYLQNASLLI
jgi:hypothetical protein